MCKEFLFVCCLMCHHLTDIFSPLYLDTDILQIDGDLVKPTMRAAVEEQLNLIAHGKADFNSVLEHTLATFTAKFKYFVEHIQAMDELFEVSFSPLASSGRPLSRYLHHALCHACLVAATVLCHVCFRHAVNGDIVCWFIA